MAKSSCYVDVVLVLRNVCNPFDRNGCYYSTEVYFNQSFKELHGGATCFLPTTQIWLWTVAPVKLKAI